MNAISRLSLALATCAVLSADAASPWNLRDGVPNAVCFAHANRVGNQYIFCMSDRGESPWRAMCAALEKKTGCRAVCRDFVTDGGLWLAQYANVRGQAVYGERISNGYLALLDFSASAAAGDAHEQEVLLENLVRAICRYRMTHSVVIVHTVASPWIARAEAVAAHYGVPTLDLTAETADAGRAAVAARFVDALFSPAPPAKATPRKLPAPLFAESDDRACIVAYEHAAVRKTGDWKAGRSSPVKPFRHLLVSDRPGATVSFTSEDCSELGLIDVVGPDSAACEYAVDGGAFRRLDIGGPCPAFRLRALPLARGLARGRRHTLTLRTVGPGTFRLGGILLNGVCPPEFAGLTALQRIDAVYGAMNPLVYTPPADRFAFLPRTMKTLREGGDLRMVLLGDSIIGDTSGSGFDLLLGRAFPKAKIHKIASIRSSTGCGWYAQENRVQEWALRHDPDLLVIGGISHGPDAEVVRSVVKQVRAARPELEILLLTPVFGGIRDPKVNAWVTYGCGGGRPGLLAGMRAVAAEERCAFFDMTTPWWDYIRSSGKTPGWFMRDVVHANARGRQIIARLLETWFVGGAQP